MFASRAFQHLKTLIFALSLSLSHSPLPHLHIMPENQYRSCLDLSLLSPIIFFTCFLECGDLVRFFNVSTNSGNQGSSLLIQRQHSECLDDASAPQKKMTETNSVSECLNVSGVIAGSQEVKMRQWKVKRTASYRVDMWASLNEPRLGQPMHFNIRLNSCLATATSQRVKGWRLIKDGQTNNSLGKWSCTNFGDPKFLVCSGKL